LLLSLVIVPLCQGFIAGTKLDNFDFFKKQEHFPCTILVK
jgi:hypothetical protein